MPENKELPPITRIAIVNELRFNVFVEVHYRREQKKFIVDLYPDQPETLLKLNAQKVVPHTNYIFECDPDDTYTVVTHDLPRDFNAITRPVKIKKGPDRGRGTNLFVMMEDDPPKFISVEQKISN